MRESPFLPRLALTVVLAFFAVFLIVPLAILFAGSFKVGDGVGFANYATVLGERMLLIAIANSVRVSAFSACCSTLIGLALTIALRATRLDARFCRMIRTVVSLPMLLPTLTYGFAIMYSFGKQGLITRLLGLELFPIYGFWGLFLGYVIYTLPSAFLLIDDAARYLDRKLGVVSALLGASTGKTLWTAWIRPLMPAIGSAFILSFILSFTDYGIPAAIGGTYHVLANRLYDTILGSIPDFGKGAVLTLVLLCPAVFAFALVKALDRLHTHSEKASTVETQRRPVRDFGFALFSALVALAILCVFAVMIVVPFTRSWPYDTRFSLTTFASALGTSNLLVSYRNSLLTSALTAILGTAIAFAAALITARSSMPAWSRRILDAFAVVSNTIPGMVIGVSFLLAYNRSSLKGTALILVCSNILHFFTTPYLMARGALMKMPRRWETAAALLGDSRLKTLRRILVPNAKATLFAMMAYLFQNAMVTISAVIFLVNTRTMLVTTKINELMYFMRFAEVFALSLLILLTNLAVKALVHLVSGASPSGAFDRTGEGKHT